MLPLTGKKAIYPNNTRLRLYCKRDESEVVQLQMCVKWNEVTSKCKETGKTYTIFCKSIVEFEKMTERKRFLTLIMVAWFTAVAKELKETGKTCLGLMNWIVKTAKVSRKPGSDKLKK